MPLNSIVPDISEGDEDIDAVINRIAAEAERNMVTMTTRFCQPFLCAQLATQVFLVPHCQLFYSSWTPDIIFPYFFFVFWKFPHTLKLVTPTYIGKNGGSNKDFFILESFLNLRINCVEYLLYSNTRIIGANNQREEILTLKLHLCGFCRN